MDLIEQNSRERGKKFFHSNKQVMEIKIEKLDGEIIQCDECNSVRFKLYHKFGGTTYGKYNRIMNSVPVKYNFICPCGKRHILNEDTFRYSKIKYGCRAESCPDGKKKMDQGCLKCPFVYEK